MLKERRPEGIKVVRARVSYERRLIQRLRPRGSRTRSSEAGRYAVNAGIALELIHQHLPAGQNGILDFRAVVELDIQAVTSDSDERRNGKAVPVDGDML